MGWPSSHEHDQEKRDDAAFVDHEMPAELKAIHIAPISPAAKRRKPKKPTRGEGAPADTRKYVERLERRVQGESLAAEKAHVDQLKRRENKSADLLHQAQVRQLRTKYEGQIAQLKSELAAKEQELDETRNLTMKSLFPKDG